MHNYNEVIMISIWYSLNPSRVSFLNDFSGFINCTFFIKQKLVSLNESLEPTFARLKVIVVWKFLSLILNTFSAQFSSSLVCFLYKFYHFSLKLIICYFPSCAYFSLTTFFPSTYIVNANFIDLRYLANTESLRK
jgi:hypothetical protein